MAKKKKDIDNNIPDETLDEVLDNVIQWDAASRVQNKNKSAPLPSSYTTQRDPKLKDLKYDFKVNEFAIRGLNKYRNILKAPTCDCCNEPAMLCLKTDEDIVDFCATVLLENGCSRSAIFLYYLNGKQRVILTVPGWDDKEECEYIENIGSAYVEGNDGFAEFDAEIGLHCYGLIIQKNKEEWMIQE